jgi:hypothetical protein
MVCQAATFEERDLSKWAQTYLKDAALMVGSFARLAEFDTSKASSYTRVIGPLGLSTKPGRDQGYAVIYYSLILNQGSQECLWHR